MAITVKVNKITKVGKSQEECKEPMYPDNMTISLKKITVTELVPPDSGVNMSRSNSLGSLCEKLTLAKAHSLTAKLEQERIHAIDHDDFSKAAQITGEMKGIQRMISAIESGDLSN